MQEITKQYSFGVVCRYKEKYLVYMSSKRVWVFHKGHYEEFDTENVAPYDGVEIVPVNQYFQYPEFMLRKPGATIVAGIRELMEESGFILPSESLKQKFGQTYREQGHLLFLKDKKISCVQEQPYVFKKPGQQILKHVTYFFAELLENTPITSEPKNMNWFTKQQFQELKANNHFRQRSLEIMHHLYNLEAKES